MPLYEIPVRLPNGTEATRKMNAETVEDAITALTEIGFEVIAPGAPEPQKVEQPEPEKAEEKPKRAKKD